jgi:tetratricopeptide (TPR) repeat protein
VSARAEVDSVSKSTPPNRSKASHPLAAPFVGRALAKRGNDMIARVKPLMTILTLAAAIALGAVAGAEEHPAKKFFISAQKHFDLAEYAEALKDFKEAYRLKDDPVFLYNIAQCERLLDHNVEALRAYKVYLQRAPNAPNRSEVERKITTLEEAIAAQEKAQKMPPSQTLESPHDTTPPPPATTPATNNAATTLTATAPEKKPVYKKAWFWAVVGGAVVAVGLGVGLGVGLTRNTNSQFPAVTF